MTETNIWIDAEEAQHLASKNKDSCLNTIHNLAKIRRCASRGLSSCVVTAISQEEVSYLRAQGFGCMVLVNDGLGMRVKISWV